MERIRFTPSVDILSPTHLDQDEWEICHAWKASPVLDEALVLTITAFAPSISPGILGMPKPIQPFFRAASNPTQICRVEFVRFVDLEGLIVQKTW